MLRVIRLLDRFQKVGIAPNTPYILRRTVAFALDAARIADLWLRRQELLYDDLVLPTIAKVIFVDELLPHVAGDLVESNAALAYYLKPEVWVGFSVVDPVSDELVQVRIRPAHGDLDDLVELVERCVSLNVDSPPDGGFAVLEGYFELVDGGIGWHCGHGVSQRRCCLG